MDTLLIAGLVLAAMLLLWLLVRSRRSRSDPRSKKKAQLEALDTLTSWHPQATRVLTAPERKAYATLRSALPENIILAQVPLARFIKVPTRHSYAEWSRRVGAISADLLVCDAASQVISVVEIRSPESQESDRTRQRHARMDRVLQAAGIPLHVWREDAMPSVTVARNLILKTPSEAGSDAPRGAPAEKIPLQNLRTSAGLEPPAEDDSQDMDPPSSTWFDELNSQPAPLLLAAPPQRLGTVDPLKTEARPQLSRA